MSANNPGPNPESHENGMGRPAFHAAYNEYTGRVPQRDLGDIILNGTPDELETLPELTADDIAALEAIANGADIRAEDAGRVHDIEAAHEEATEEDAERTLAAQQTQPEEEPQEAPRQASETNLAVSAARAAAAHQSTRAQAQAALRGAGSFSGHIPSSATVTRSPIGNFFTVVDGMHVMLIRPRAVGDRYEVTDYRYNEEDNTLRISIRGRSSLTRPQGVFVPEGGDGPESVASGEVVAPEPGEAIDLPPAVSRVMGFSSVTRAPAHS